MAEKQPQRFFLKDHRQTTEIPDVGLHSLPVLPCDYLALLMLKNYHHSFVLAPSLSGPKLCGERAHKKSAVCRIRRGKINTEHGPLSGGTVVGERKGKGIGGSSSGAAGGRCCRRRRRCWSLDIPTTRGEQSSSSSSLSWSSSSSFGVTNTAWWPEWELPRMFFGPRVGFCVVLISY